MALVTLQVRREVVGRDPDPDPGHTHTENGGIEMMMPSEASRRTMAAQRATEAEFHEEVPQDRSEDPWA
jgi:hypothetical protein